MDNVFKSAPHNPPHWFQANATNMLTASVYQNQHLILSPERKLHGAMLLSKLQNYTVGTLLPGLS
jgi:hypothetical protein